MNNENAVIVFGRLGKNPELKYTAKQEPVCYLSIAENKTGQERPSWHQVIVWGKQAEQCNLFLEKGSEVFVRGRIFVRDSQVSGSLKKIEELKADRVGIIHQ